MAKVDVEDGHEAAAEFSMRVVPTFVARKDAQPVATISGAMGKQRCIDWASAAVA